MILACELDLPFTPAPDSGEVDVTILVALGQPWIGAVPQVYREFRRREGGWRLRYRNDVGGWLHFEHDTKSAELAVSGSLAWEEAVPVLVGVACAALLSTRGTPMLHGAAVAFDGRAIAILGDSGQGKSTLAAALLRSGAQLLSEDLLVLTQKSAT